MIKSIRCAGAVRGFSNARRAAARSPVKPISLRTRGICVPASASFFIVLGSFLHAARRYDRPFERHHDCFLRSRSKLRSPADRVRRRQTAIDLTLLDDSRRLAVDEGLAWALRTHHLHFEFPWPVHGITRSS
jgi:hypothetical protein